MRRRVILYLKVPPTVCSPNLYVGEHPAGRQGHPILKSVGPRQRRGRVILYLKVGGDPTFIVDAAVGSHAMVDKPDLHDVWEHDGDTMRKFSINDQVVPLDGPLTDEWASWGPREMHDGSEEVFEECDVFLVSNSVSKKVFGSTFWFHELTCFLPVDHELVADDVETDREYVPVKHIGPFNAADLRAPTDVEEVDLR